MIPAPLPQTTRRTRPPLSKALHVRVFRRESVGSTNRRIDVTAPYRTSLSPPIPNSLMRLRSWPAWWTRHTPAAARRSFPRSIPLPMGRRDLT